MRILIIFCLAHLILGCGSEEYLEKTVTSEKSVKYFKEHVEIPIGVDFLPDYHVFDTYEGENFMFIGYNYIDHSLDIFNIDSLHHEGKIFLEDDGPFEVNHVENICYYNRDSIFIYERGSLNIINSEGRVVDNISLTDKVNFFEFGELGTNSFFRLVANRDSEEIYFFNLFPKIESKNDERSIISALDLRSKKFKLLPINFSKYYFDNNGSMGHLSFVNFSNIVNNTLIFNFQYESNIYKFDLETEKISKFGASIENIKPLAVPFYGDLSDANDWSIHAIENTYYLAVLYDKWRNLYYRFIWHSLPFQKGENEYNSVKDKGIAITVLDEDFTIVGLIELDKATYSINKWFVGSQGLYIAKTHLDNLNMKEDYLIFDCFQFEY